VRQMMRKVRIDNAGDSDLFACEIVSQLEWEEANAKALSEGGEPAIAQTVLLGLIRQPSTRRRGCRRVVSRRPPASSPKRQSPARSTGCAASRKTSSSASSSRRDGPRLLPEAS